MFQVPQGWKRPRAEDLPAPCDALVMMSILAGLAGDIMEAFVLTSRMAAAKSKGADEHSHLQQALQGLSLGLGGASPTEAWAHWGCANGHTTCFAAGSTYVAEMAERELILPPTSQSFLKDVDPKLFAALQGRIAKGEFAGVKNKGKEKAV